MGHTCKWSSTSPHLSRAHSSESIHTLLDATPACEAFCSSMVWLCHRESSVLNERMELEAVVVFPWTLLSCPAVLTVAKHCCCAIASSDVSSGEAHYTTLPKEPVWKVEPHVLAMELEGLTVVRHGSVLGGVEGVACGKASAVVAGPGAALSL